MMSLGSRKKVVRILSIIGVLFLGYAFYYTWQLLAIGTAYKAKILCSGVFVSKRNPQDILNEDLEGILDIIHAEIDFNNKSVTASFPGIPTQHAIFRDGCGCTLLAGASEMEVRAQTRDMDTRAFRVSSDELPGFKDLKEGLPPEVSPNKLDEAVDNAFLETDPDHPVRTRAVVVVYNGQIIAEHYATGISKDTPLPGWSMTKSVTNALVGILIKEGKLSIHEPVGLPEWSGAEDPRKQITMDHLLRMSSGLKFDDRSGPVVSDVNRMLLRSPDVAAYAISKPLEHKPDSHWYYSSGTTNIISRIIRDCIGGSLVDYLVFPRDALFNKIGMQSAIMEPDTSGTFVTSSFMYASARDWARFGLLYLQDGVWEGERILPKGWVSYTVTPSQTAPKGKYGAHFWTNGGKSLSGNAKPLKRLPSDTFYAAGYESQYIMVIPSRKIVVVRLGQTKDPKTWDMEAFTADVLAVISNGT